MCSVRGPTSLGWCNFRNLSHEIVFSGLRARRVRRRVESIYSRRSGEPKAACQRKPKAPLALSSTERLHKKPFACLPTALRPSGPVQQWIFHQAEQKLTTLPGLRYSSGHRKGRLKVLILRNGTHVLGNRHHEDAVLLAAVRHDVHRGAALVAGARQGTDHGPGRVRVVGLELIVSSGGSAMTQAPHPPALRAAPATV